jgi:hypothetical protein
MYFETPGKHNTQETLRLAVEAAKENGITHIVVASNTGETALPLLGCGLQVVCVSHAYGFMEKGKNELSAETRARLEGGGIRVCTAAHVLSGAERGISKRLGGAYPAELIAHTLRMLGAGVKVCVECAVMALDAGLIPYGEKIVAIAGTKSGADTAMILTPGYASDILDTYINEIICKPGARK